MRVIKRADSGDMTMITRLEIAAISIVTLALSACGVPHHTVVTQPNNLVMFKQVTLLPVEVSSGEQSPDALAVNEKWKKWAMDELQSLMATKNIEVSSNSQATVACRIEIVYGNRALRYFIGFGAGAGHIQVDITLKDSNGIVRYATNSKADLAVGVVGGDMSQVVQDTIETAVKEFGSKL